MPVSIVTKELSGNIIPIDQLVGGALAATPEVISSIGGFTLTSKVDSAKSKCRKGGFQNPIGKYASAIV